MTKPRIEKLNLGDFTYPDFEDKFAKIEKKINELIDDRNEMSSLLNGIHRTLSKTVIDKFN